MKKLFILLILSIQGFAFAQENNNDTSKETEKKESFSFLPQIYTYVNHHMNHGNNFLADGHEADFIGVGLQLNIIKYHNVKFGIGWEFNDYDVTNTSTIGNIENSSYFAMFSKIQYQWDVLNRWSVEPYLGAGATKIQQKYNNSNRDSFYGMNLYAGLNVTFKIGPHFSLFTGLNYNNLRFNVDTNKRWEDYFNKVNQTQLHLGIIASIGKN